MCERRSYAGVTSERKAGKHPDFEQIDTRDIDFCINGTQIIPTKNQRASRLSLNNGGMLCSLVAGYAGGKFKGIYPSRAEQENT